MSAICLLDTSVFVEILNVPSKAQRHVPVTAQLKEKIQANELLFLPMATIFETGNHIGQNGDGRQRRACATTFVEQVMQALAGQSPFQPISFLSSDVLQVWLHDFPNHAMKGSGFGDLSIIQDWRRLCDLHLARRVYIWTLDGHLAHYDKPPRI